MNAVQKILSFITGLFLALVFSVLPLREDAFLLTLKEPITRASTEIELVYENKTGRSVSFCADNYTAQRKTETGWVAEPRLLAAAVNETITVISPRRSARYTIALSAPLEAGTYRISQTYRVETYTLKPPFKASSQSYTAVAEFTVT